ncbi:alpha/beta fold hydrolase [Nocardioides sp. Bht2]|uniref:alpha/beta fold hydrolase n=1 Tax=Nocardioides sp. Bht2 TaxID=3392297 RepID=UPI0039B65020
MATFLLVHGAWHQGSAWDLVRPLLTDAGHQVLTPSLDLSPGIGLADHITALREAIAATPEPATVVAHSYTGIPASLAVAHAPARQLVLLDAWLTPAGSSMLDVAPDWFADWCRAAATGDPAMLPVPSLRTVGVAEESPEATWLAPQLVPHPFATFTDSAPTAFTPGSVELHAILCKPSKMPFTAFAEAAGATCHELASGHDAMVTAPKALAELLLTIAS